MSDTLEAKIDAAVARVITATVCKNIPIVGDFEKAALAYAPAYHEAMDLMQYGGNRQATMAANAASKAWEAADNALIAAARALALALYEESKS